MRSFWLIPAALWLGSLMPAPAAEPSALQAGPVVPRGLLGLALDPEERAYYAGIDAVIRERDRAEADLFHRRPRTALRRLQAVLARRWPQGVEPRELVASTLARVLAQLEDYAGARRWQHIDVYEYPSSCGVHQSGREQRALILDRVWAAAQYMKAGGRQELERLVRGEVRLLSEREALSEPYARESAAAEAKLILGQLLLREGRHGEGLAMLCEATQGVDIDRRSLAESFLR